MSALKFLRPRHKFPELKRVAMTTSLGWNLFLCCISLVGASVSILVFMPGGSNTDSIWQRRQIMGMVPLSDWHPPIMTLAWKSLFQLTGTQTSLLFLQVGLLFTTSWVLACYVFAISKSRISSALTASIFLLPQLFIYVGAMWKDSQMACAFLVSAVSAVIAKRYPRLRWFLLTVSFAALVYGTCVRKNAFFAVLPLVVLIYWAARRHAQNPRRRITAVAGCAAVAVTLLIAVGGTNFFIDAMAKPIHTRQSSQVMLDDVVFTVPSDEIRDSSAPDSMKQKLLSAQTKCKASHTYEDSYWACYGRGEDGIYTAIANPDALEQLWISHVVRRPDRYFAYRIQTFSHFLFDNYHPWDGSSVYRNNLGIATTFPQLNDAGHTYVKGIGKQLPWLFSGWFWLASSLIVIFHVRKLWQLEERSLFPQLTLTTTMLASSAAIYVFGYFPIVPTNHYRYIYWPAMAVTVDFVLIATAWRMARKKAPALITQGNDRAMAGQRT